MAINIIENNTDSLGTVNDSDVVFTDITTGNASTTKHGYLKKLSGTATQYLGGDGNFTTPSGTPLDINALTGKTTPADNDITVIEDSAASFAKKKLSWVNIKATLKTYFDSLYEVLTNKDATGGYVGLTLFKINFKNVANTFTSFFTNTNTAARTYTFQDRNGTIIDTTNLVTGSTDNAIIRADGTGGATTQSTGITIDDSNNIVLPTTTAGATTGIIYKGSVRFIHNYQPSGIAEGYNLFIGLDAGNLTMVSGANNYNTSRNIGIGVNALKALTSGQNNVAIGYDALTLDTTGISNFGLGTFALSKVTTNSFNTAVGTSSGQNTTGAQNTNVGTFSGQGTLGSSTYSYCVIIGTNAGQLLTTGSYNVLIGRQAGNLLTSGASNIIIGDDVDPSANNASNELNIGNVLYGTGLYGTGRLGFTNSPTARLHLPAGTTSASSAPFKFTSGSLQTTAEAGAVEFLTDKGYLTITTGAARKEITLNDSALTSGKVPIATTNGRLTDGVGSLAIAGSSSYGAITETTFQVTIGVTMANSTYKVNVTPTNSTSAALFYVTNKTTTTFDVVYLVAITGTVAFDWAVFP